MANAAISWCTISVPFLSTMAILSTDAYDANDASSYDADGSSAMLDATDASSNANAATNNATVSC